MPQPTNINAFRMELQDAEKEEAQAHSRVEALKETIATMEQAAREAENAPAEESTQEEDSTAERSEAEKLAEYATRPVLEKRAKKAGIDKPNDKEKFPNKEVLAQAVLDAEAESEDDSVAAQDADLPPASGGDPVDQVPSQPIIETPNDSDMPPASSETPTEVTSGDNKNKR